MKLIETYFNEVDFYTQKYGEKTIVLMQVGAFYEVYGKKHSSLNSLIGSKINEFSQICGFSIANKSKVSITHTLETGKVIECDAVMAGFRDYMCDKYISQLNSNGYTCIIISQDANDPTNRSLSQIITPGTYFDEDSNVTTNNIMVINLHHNKKTVLIWLISFIMVSQILIFSLVKQ
jgi:DNA mismatch repair protein MutS